MTAPLDTLHVLTTRGPLATKTVGPDADGRLSIREGYGNAARFRSHEIPLNGAGDLFAALPRLEGAPRSFVVRAARLETADSADMGRRIHPKWASAGVLPPTLRPTPRRVLFIDFDRVDDPDAPDPREAPEAAAERLRARLPACLRATTCWFAYTASANLKLGLSGRASFWLDRALDDGEAGRLLEGAPVDLATTRAAQPIYTARPVFVGGAVDPLPRRSFVLPGGTDTVPVPALPPPPPPLPPSPPPTFRSSSGAGAYAHAALRRECDAVVAAPEGGRHERLNTAAFVLARFVATGDLTTHQVLESLAWAARKAKLTDPAGELRRFIGVGLHAGVARAGR